MNVLFLKGRLPPPRSEIIFRRFPERLLRKIPHIEDLPRIALRIQNLVEYCKAGIFLRAGARDDHSPVCNGKERGFYIAEAVVRINNYKIVLSGCFRAADQIKICVHSDIIKLQISW